MFDRAVGEPDVARGVHLDGGGIHVHGGLARGQAGRWDAEGRVAELEALEGEVPDPGRRVCGVASDRQEAFDHRRHHLGLGDVLAGRGW